jgi:hypothetical protein
MSLTIVKLHSSVSVCLYQFDFPCSRVWAGAALKLYPEPNSQINDAAPVFVSARIHSYLLTIINEPDLPDLQNCNTEKCLLFFHFYICYIFNFLKNALADYPDWQLTVIGPSTLHLRCDIKMPRRDFKL